MRVLLAGASGLIGTALKSAIIADGHTVRTLVRRPPRSRTEVEWRPEHDNLSLAAIEGIDAVVCLSGAGVGDHRWTPAYRKTILESRIAPVATLARAIATAPERPKTFLTGSAVGYYGDTGSRMVDESAPNGDTFLAEVCRAWEDSAEPAARAGVRVAHLRTGIVLARRGPVLARMVPLFRLGVGGRLGSGQQYWPWVTLSDEVAAIRFLLTAQLFGPVNITAPQPVTNAEFTRALAEVLHRPAVVPVPTFALTLALGGFAGEIVASQRVVPTKLLAAGFEFSYPQLEAGLRAELAS